MDEIDVGARALAALRADGRAPNFFVVGAQKSGTTGLAATLAEHPDVFMPAIKEPNFFCTDVDPRDFAGHFKLLDLQSEEGALATAARHELRYAYIKTPANYARLFDDAAGRPARGEASVSYLYSATAAAEIARFAPDARLVALLRDPIARAFSAFKMQRRAGLEDHERFVDAVRADAERPARGWGQKHLYVELGRYAPQLTRYFAQFPREQVLVLLYDEFRDAPAAVTARVLAHIGARPDAAPLAVRRENVSRVPRFAGLNRILFRSGLKRRLHQLLPRWVAERGRKLYYGRSDERPSATDRAALRPWFEDDWTALETMLRVDLAAWRGTLDAT